MSRGRFRLRRWLRGWPVVRRLDVTTIPELAATLIERPHPRVLDHISVIPLDEAHSCPAAVTGPSLAGHRLVLLEIAMLVASHTSCRAGELNQVLSICQGVAWEVGDEVEENNVSTLDRRVHPPWMSPPTADPPPTV